MFELIAFYTFAFLTLSAFLVVVMSNNILYALSALAFGMILVSSFYFLLGADFLGVVQIIVYTGAIVVMYAFGMMFFDINKEVKEKFHNQFIVWCICGALALCLFIVVGAFSTAGQGRAFSTSELAHLLYKDYLVAFEAAAIMLLMAMIAGVGLGAHKAEFPQDLRDDLAVESSFSEIRLRDNAKVIDINEVKIIESKNNTIEESIVSVIKEIDSIESSGDIDSKNPNFTDKKEQK